VGANITDKAIKAVIVFLVLCSLYIWLRFEGKMAVGALSALLHDIVVTAGIYSLSGFQVSPDTVIAFFDDPRVLPLRHHRGVRQSPGKHQGSGLHRAPHLHRDGEPVHEPGAGPFAHTSFVAILPILSILLIGSVLLHATRSTISAWPPGRPHHRRVLVHFHRVAHRRLLKEREPPLRADPRTAGLPVALRASLHAARRGRWQSDPSGGGYAAIVPGPRTPPRRSPPAKPGYRRAPDAADGAATKPDATGTPVDEPFRRLRVLAARLPISRWRRSRRDRQALRNRRPPRRAAATAQEAPPLSAGVRGQHADPH